MNVRLALNVIVILASVTAGLLWLKSALVTVRHRPGRSAFTINDTDINETMRAQSKWNAYAACAATVAAMVQALAVFL
jgi:hypothetical protein